MKILFINLPYAGHVIPTIGLVQELVRAGYEVAYLLPHNWENRISGSGATFLGYENSPKLDKQIRNAFFLAESVIDDFDILIYEQFFFAGKHLAEKHGKKCVRIFTAPATNHELMKQFLSSGGPMGIFRSPLIGTLWTQDAVKGWASSSNAATGWTRSWKTAPIAIWFIPFASSSPMRISFRQKNFTSLVPLSTTVRRNLSQVLPAL